MTDREFFEGLLPAQEKVAGNIDLAEHFLRLKKLAAAESVLPHTLSGALRGGALGALVGGVSGGVAAGRDAELSDRLRSAAKGALYGSLAGVPLGAGAGMAHGEKALRTAAREEGRVAEAIRRRLMSKSAAARVDVLPGGQGDALQPGDVNPQELKEGIKDESEEHMQGNKALGQEIALDHLAKDPNFYSKQKAQQSEEGGQEGTEAEDGGHDPEILQTMLEGATSAMANMARKKDEEGAAMSAEKVASQWLVKMAEKQPTNQERVQKALSELPLAEIEKLAYEAHLDTNTRHFEEFTAKVAAYDRMGRELAHKHGDGLGTMVRDHLREGVEKQAEHTGTDREATVRKYKAIAARRRKAAEMEKAAAHFGGRAWANTDSSEETPPKEETSKESPSTKSSVSGHFGGRQWPKKPPRKAEEPFNTRSSLGSLYSDDYGDLRDEFDSPWLHQRRHYDPHEYARAMIAAETLERGLGRMTPEQRAVYDQIDKRGLGRTLKGGAIGTVGGALLGAALGGKSGVLKHGLRAGLTGAALGLLGGGLYHQAKEGHKQEQMLREAAYGDRPITVKMLKEAMMGKAPGDAPETPIAKYPSGNISAHKRESLKSSQFAIPAKKAKSLGVAGEIKGEAKGKYPIHDEKHARNALARVSAYGTSGEKATVRKKVYSKYPGLKEGFEERHGGTSPTSKGMLTKDKMEKTAVVGLLPEPVSQTLGGLLGYHAGRVQAERGEPHSFGIPQAAGAAFVPGGMGYQIGRALGHKRITDAPLRADPSMFPRPKHKSPEKKEEKSKSKEKTAGRDFIIASMEKVAAGAVGDLSDMRTQPTYTPPPPGTPGQIPGGGRPQPLSREKLQEMMPLITHIAMQHRRRQAAQNPEVLQKEAGLIGSAIGAIKPLATKAVEAAKPLASKAIEAAKPLAEKATAAAKPLVGKAARYTFQNPTAGGAIGGAALGAGTGALAAPEGHRLSGALKGGLVGGAGGAALGRFSPSTLQGAAITHLLK